MFHRLRTGVINLMVGVFLVGVIATSTASAAVGSSNGMKVAPVRTDLVMQPGETKTVNVQLQNVTNADGVYKIITNDFESRDETGAPALLLNGGSNARHGLKSYMTTPKTVNVASGEQKTVPVTITLPKDIAGGGYYGAVRFAPATSDSDNANVSLSGSVASLVLVSVPGDINENLQIASFDARQNDSAKFLFTNNDNIKAAVRFRNSGNVQEQPFGKILLKKGDKTLGSYEINNSEPRGNVLPDSVRKFEVSLKDVGDFGKYTIEGNFGYGSNGQLLTAKTSFYVIPMWILIIVLVLIALLLLLVIGGPKLLKRYKQNVLRSAGRH